MVPRRAVKFPFPARVLRPNASRPGLLPKCHDCRKNLYIGHNLIALLRFTEQKMTNIYIPFVAQASLWSTILILLQSHLSRFQQLFCVIGRGNHYKFKWIMYLFSDSLIAAVIYIIRLFTPVTRVSILLLRQLETKTDQVK